MMSREQNDQLSRVGPGTFLGKLLRRYWAPFLRRPKFGTRLPAGAGEADGRKPDLLSRQQGPHWTDRRILRPSRRVALVWSERGMRFAFPYHGWKYDVTGQCVDLPSEPEESGFRRNIKLKSYPCIEKAGIIWAYLGPSALQPPPPALEWTEVEPPQRFVSKRLQECNYLQAMEGGIDSSHVSWLHGSELNKDPLFKGSKGNVYNEQDRMPLFEVEEFPGGLLIGARRMPTTASITGVSRPGSCPGIRSSRRARAIHWARTPGCRLMMRRAGPGASTTTQTRIDEIGGLGDAGW